VTAKEEEQEAVRDRREKKIACERVIEKEESQLQTRPTDEA